jgi:integrase
MGHIMGQSKRQKRKMKANTLQFTQGFIERTERVNKRIKYWDTKVTGLVLEVMPSGSKIFRYCRTVNFKQQWATIGQFPKISLEEARDAAIKLSAQLVDGEQFSHSRDELTLDALAKLYFDQYAQDRCVTAPKMRQNFNRWWLHERPQKLSRIDTECIQLRINLIASDGRYRTANHALALLKAIYNWGIRRKLIKINPAVGVDKFKEKSRERFVQPNEFPNLLDAINSYHDERVRDFFLMCLWTGARSGNVMAMRWDELELDSGTWRIPETKNGDSQTIKLIDSALAILKERAKTKQLNPWVFPGGRFHTGTNHMVDARTAWKNILSKAGITNLKCHDLRRTLASYMVMTGASTPIVQKQLGHKSLAAAAVYQRVNNDPVKVAAEEAVALMQHYARETTVRKLRK